MSLLTESERGGGAASSDVPCSSHDIRLSVSNTFLNLFTRIFF